MSNYPISVSRPDSTNNTIHNTINVSSAVETYQVEIQVKHLNNLKPPNLGIPSWSMLSTSKRLPRMISLLGKLIGGNLLIRLLVLLIMYVIFQPPVSREEIRNELMVDLSWNLLAAGIWEGMWLVVTWCYHVWMSSRYVPPSRTKSELINRIPTILFRECPWCLQEDHWLEEPPLLPWWRPSQSRSWRPSSKVCQLSYLVGVADE